MHFSEHAPQLKYRRTEVNSNIYNMGAPAFSINSQNAFLAIGACPKKRDYTVKSLHNEDKAYFLQIKSLHNEDNAYSLRIFVCLLRK